MYVTRSAHAALDVMQEKRVDYFWNVDSNRSLSDSLRGFTKITPLREKAPKGFLCSGKRLTKVQTTARPEHVWPEEWTPIGNTAQNPENKSGKTRSQNSTMLDDCEKSTLLVLMTKITKKLSKNARRKLVRPCGSSHAAQKESSDQQHESGCGGNRISPGSRDHLWSCSGISWIHKTTSGAFSAEKSLKITLQAKDLLRWPITMWFTNLFLRHKRWSFRMRKQQWTRNGRSSRRFQPGNSTRWRGKKGGYSRSTQR